MIGISDELIPWQFTWIREEDHRPVLMLDHQDSTMVRHYYHLHDKPSQEQMARMQFIGTPKP